MHRLTSSLFKGLVHTRSFYDNIYIFTKSNDINKHLEALRDVLEILKKNRLYVKLSKCVFCAAEIPGLGDFIGRNGVRYVQRFCGQYAELTAPLFTLLEKKNQHNSKITLNADQLKNFKELKRRLADTPVLHLPDFTKQMHLRTDASQFAIGGVLFQEVSGVERPIAFTSRMMKSAELKYATQQQELLAILNALAVFRIYCLDQPVVIETDHKSLKADALSRRPDLKPETKAFHDLLLPSFNETSYQHRVTEIRHTSNLTKTIFEGYKKDKIIQEIRRVIERSRDSSTAQGVSGKQYKTYFVENNLVWYQGSTDVKPRIVVPNIMSLKHKIIAEVHDSNFGGHPGLMEPLQIPDERWRSISMDFITDLPDTKRGNNSIWVVVDRLTKRSHFVPTVKTVSAQEVALLFIDNIWRLHGMPQDIVSNRDTKFISGFWSHVFEDVGPKLKMTVAYRAQGDGQTERTNRTLEEYLRCFVSPRQDNWDEHLANPDFAIKSAVNSSIKISPFEADLGYVPANPLPALAASKRRRLRGGRQPGVKIGEHQATVLRQCQEALEDSQAYMADMYDKGRTEQAMKIGDRVYYARRISTQYTQDSQTLVISVPSGLDRTQWCATSTLTSATNHQA
ncbi:unnamed protein product [Phytophthora fragariaefolia]|uniref:Unnamed protein product n=1 Tax=Phytophthora fragariaefolia TaxID=1490495 RepID=A0A9W7CY38_9STRA|nr:unnamed protein product [Phytophthora fragariaefolia]